MSAQAIHILALLVLFPASVGSLVWLVAALRFLGGFGVTWRSVVLSGTVCAVCWIALVYVAYHPHALPHFLSGVVLPPNPFNVEPK